MHKVIRIISTNVTEYCTYDDARNISLNYKFIIGTFVINNI